MATKQYITPSGLKIEGWTDGAICRFLGEPDDTCRNPHYRNAGAPMRLYKLDRVETVRISPDFISWREKMNETRTNRSLKASAKVVAMERQTAESFCHKYPHWADALPEAAEALFKLNRFAKVASFSTRERIYAAKGAFVNLLYKNGYSTGCFVHLQHQEAQECFGCDGTGADWGEDCGRCGGTGEYRPARTNKIVCFDFLIGGVKYCWHTPARLVTFKYKITKEAEAWLPRDGADAPTVSTGDVSKALMMINRVVDEAGKESVGAVVALAA